jgi:DNA-binding NarL/FixJ family response regulator
MRLFILDDHPIFRVGLRSLLAATGEDWEVTGEAASAREAFPLIEATRPDVVMLDLVLPGMDGCSAARELRRRVPEARLLVLTLSESPHDVLEAFDAGVSGYALKSDSREALFEALRKVAHGERYIDPRVAQGWLAGEGGPWDQIFSRLSNREREVFRLAADGLANDQIAVELCISRKTVETHRYRIQKKFGLRSPDDLVRFAAQHGMIHRR